MPETRILILSDAHLFHSEHQELFGVNPYRMLETTIRHIRSHREKFELLVALGDLAEDGTEEAYGHFRKLTEGLADSVIWVKGNHDDFSNVPVPAGNHYLKSTFSPGSWRLIFLDTALQGNHGGMLTPQELERLQNFLAADHAAPKLIFMHHQPLDVGSAFIDKLGLSNKEEFWETVSGNKSVKGVIFGHVHQEIDRMYRGVRVMSAPATSVQFKAFSKQPVFETERQGYRILNLKNNGKLETSMNWIRQV